MFIIKRLKIRQKDPKQNNMIEYFFRYLEN